jgi:lipopolysaccharide transport system permease protein
MNSEGKIQHYIDIIIVLTQKEMKVRYKSSFLGYLWSIAQPLAFALVFFVAFKIVMRIDIKNYALFLIAGLFPWQWFSNSVNASATIFLGNASIIKKVNFPRNSLLVANIIQDGIHFVLSIPVIVFFLILYHQSPSLVWFYAIPALLVLQFFMTFGACLAISSINLFFRDLERLTTIFLTLIFYFTPIIYPESMLPDQYKIYINVNPFAPLIICWRELFLKGTLNLLSLAAAFAYSTLFFLIGYSIYRKLSYRFAEVL